mgnify:CR=1 FL=1
MSGGFRRLLGRRETARFKAFVLAIVIQMLVLAIAFQFVTLQTWIPKFPPIGVIVGGLLFGMAMGWSAGCPAGIWYKLGGGNVSVFLSLVGMFLGYASMEIGTLKGIRLWLQSIDSFSQSNHHTLPSLLGYSHTVIALLIGSVTLFFLWRSNHQDKTGSWKWWISGSLLGLIGLLAWLSSTFSQRPFGMAILAGSKDVFWPFISGNSGFLSWDFCFVVGIPLGGYISARHQKSFSWGTLQGQEALKRLSGGLLLGMSSSLAGGCTVGHGLSGIPMLSLGSIVFILFAILGTWLMEALAK